MDQLISDLRSDRALGFRWPPIHPSTGDTKRTTFAAGTHTLQRNYFIGVRSIIDSSDAIDSKGSFEKGGKQNEGLFCVKRLRTVKRNGSRPSVIQNVAK